MIVWDWLAVVVLALFAGAGALATLQALLVSRHRRRTAAHGAGGADSGAWPGNTGPGQAPVPYAGPGPSEGMGPGPAPEQLGSHYKAAAERAGVPPKWCEVHGDYYWHCWASCPVCAGEEQHHEPWYQQHPPAQLPPWEGPPDPYEHGRPHSHRRRVAEPAVDGVTGVPRAGRWIP